MKMLGGLHESRNNESKRKRGWSGLSLGVTGGITMHLAPDGGNGSRPEEFFLDKRMMSGCHSRKPYTGEGHLQ